MFGKMVEMNGLSGRKGLKCLLGAVAGVAFFGPSSHAQAQNIELYTTHDDWSAWTTNDANESAAVQSTPDSDGGLINGIANTAGSGAGNVSASGGGSVLVTELAQTYDFVYGGNYAVGPTNTVLAPALVANLASNGGTGLLRIDFTEPTPTAGNPSTLYFQLGVVFNYGDYGSSGIYQSEFQFDQNGSGQQIFAGPNGFMTELLPYTISNPALMLNDTSSSTYFQIGLIINSNYDIGAPGKGGGTTYSPISFSVDDISIQVPEPASMGLVGAGLSLLTLRRRRRNA